MGIMDDLKGLPVIRDFAGSGDSKKWFTFGKTHGGKIVCLGPSATEEEADEQLAKLREGQTYCLPTRDLSRAKSMIRAKLMRETEDVDGVMSPMGSKIQNADDYAGREKRGYEPERF